MGNPKGSRPDESDRGPGKAEARPPVNPGRMQPTRVDPGWLDVEYELRDDPGARRPFAAAYDLSRKLWRFAGLPAPSGPVPLGPGVALAQAVQTLVQEAIRLGRFSADDLMIDAKARHLHVAGFASAEEVGQPVCRELLRAYLKSLKEGGPGDGIEVRPGDGARIAVRFASDAAPVLPPAADPGPLAPLPADALADLTALRAALVPRHQTVVATVQQALDRLTGKHAPDIETNRAVAAAVNALADGYGVALLYDGRPVVVRVVPVRRDPGGSFQARLTGSDPKVLKTSMAFPPLTAASKATVSPPAAPGTDETNAPPAE